MKAIYIEPARIRDYSIAPYNFISLPEFGVYPYRNPGELPGFNSYRHRGEELLNGVINYEIEAKTPIIVWDQVSNMETREISFFRNIDGQYTIPSSSIRGLIRSNSQILSFSPIVSKDYSEIGDRQFFYRDISSGTRSSRKYKAYLGLGSGSLANNVLTGYMTKKGDNYFIRESENLPGFPNYIRIREIDLHRGLYSLKTREENLMYRSSIKPFIGEIESLNKKISRRGTGQATMASLVVRRDKILNQHRNRSYRAYSRPVSFNYDPSLKKLIDLGEPGQYTHEAYLLSSNYIRGKMGHYLVVGPGENSRELQLSRKSIDFYLEDLLSTRKARKTSSGIRINESWSFYDLPDENELKPVFYIEKAGEFNFGFLPLLRIRHEKSILQGLPKSYREGRGISYTDSIFGFSSRWFQELGYISYKSRVDFSDLVSSNGEVDLAASMVLDLYEPKPNSYNLYLRNREGEVSLYEEGFEIGGVKRYWLKDYIEGSKRSRFKNPKDFSIRPLKRGSRFRGRIYFRNLREEELGLLIYSLVLREGSNQSLGMGKPQGFGRIKVDKIQLSLEDLPRKYGSFSLAYYRERNPKPYIDLFKECFSSQYLDGEKLDDQTHIRELYKMTETIIPRKFGAYYRDMLHGQGDFEKRRPLPGILNYEACHGLVVD